MTKEHILIKLPNYCQESKEWIQNLNYKMNLKNNNSKKRVIERSKEENK